MIMWLYVYEPHTGRKLLAVSRDGVVTIYWRMNGGQFDRRPVGVEAGSSRWKRGQDLERGQSTTFGDVRILHTDEGHLYAEGKEASGQRYAQLFKRVQAGAGEPPHLSEVWP